MSTGIWLISFEQRWCTRTSGWLFTIDTRKISPTQTAASVHISEDYKSQWDVPWEMPCFNFRTVQRHIARYNRYRTFAGHFMGMCIYCRQHKRYMCVKWKIRTSRPTMLVKISASEHIFSLQDTLKASSILLDAVFYHTIPFFVETHNVQGN